MFCSILLWMFCLVLLLIVCRGWLVSASFLLRCPRAACLGATVTCHCETVDLLTWIVTSPSGDKVYGSRATGENLIPSPDNDDFSASLSVDSSTSTPAFNSSFHSNLGFHCNLQRGFSAKWEHAPDSKYVRSFVCSYIDSYELHKYYIIFRFPLSSCQLDLHWNCLQCWQFHSERLPWMMGEWPLLATRSLWTCL